MGKWMRQHRLTFLILEAISKILPSSFGRAIVLKGFASRSKIPKISFSPNPSSTSSHPKYSVLFLIWLLLFGCFISCDEGENPASGFKRLGTSVCRPGQGPFANDIDNEYFPLPVGLKLVLEGKEDGESVRVEIEVLDETEEVAGVTTRVVTETEYEDDELIEITRDFFVQAPNGTVCYYGEDVDNYKNGKIVSHNGSWRVGQGDNLPGIMMPGNPIPETKFSQENAPKVAEDMSAIISLGESVSVPAGDFDDVLHAIDWNPLEGERSGDAEDKFYAKGIGLIVDDVVELVSYSMPDT